MKYVYILKAGETFPSTKEKMGDFHQWIIKTIGREITPIKTIHIRENEKLPNLRSALGVIITGSHDMVSDELEWSLKLERYIRQINTKEIPLLGICYGHQLIAKALGGKSGFNPKGKEIGRVKIKRLKSSENDPLFKGFAEKFWAFETHYQSALKLPSNAIILASNAKDKHQAVRFSTNTWGVQFHPEFDKEVMKEYILNQNEGLKKLGLDAKSLLQKVDRCEMSHQILHNFIQIAREKNFH